MPKEVETNIRVAKALAKAIKKAFASVPYPGDDNIAYHQSYKPSDGWNCAEVFRGKDWLDIAPMQLRKCSSTACLTPEAFHYFLPAYLMARIESPIEADVAAEFIVYALVPPKDKDSLTLWFEKIERLSLQQKKAVSMFLINTAADPLDDSKAAQDALDVYWGRFAAL